MNFTCKNKIIKFLVFCLLFLVATPVFAADVFLLPESNDLADGELYEVELFVSSQETINAFEGKILFSEAHLKLEEIKNSNSIINLWIEKPEKDKDGEIFFSGIIPGGYIGNKGYLFTMVFKSLASGNGQIKLGDVTILKNDGSGTPAKVELTHSAYKISEKSAGQVNNLSQSQIVYDKDKPEGFKPEIAQDLNIFEGKWFIVFATQDKGVGIDHYEIREGFFKKFTLVESPYLLKNQKLNKKIWVKAVDKSGNNKIEAIYPPNWLSWYENYRIIGIIILVAIFMYALIKISWRKFAK